MIVFWMYLVKYINVKFTYLFFLFKNLAPRKFRMIYVAHRVVDCILLLADRATLGCLEQE